MFIYIYRYTYVHTHIALYTWFIPLCSEQIGSGPSLAQCLSHRLQPDRIWTKDLGVIDPKKQTDTYIYIYVPLYRSKHIE